jgi:hypothetical protein
MKNVFVFIVQFPNIGQRLAFEKEVRREKIFQNREEICLEFCQATDPVELKYLLRLKVPNVVLFHECPNDIINENIDIIKVILKKDFQIILMERLRFNNQIGIKISNFEELSLYLN